MKNFEPLVQRVRGRINLKRNVRLREALAESGDDPARRLDAELPAAVAVEWTGLHPDQDPPTAKEVKKLTNDELKPLVNAVTRRIEKQASVKENKIVRAVHRMPAGSGISPERQEELRWKIDSLLAGVKLTKREQEFAELFLDDHVYEEEIASLMGIDQRSVDKLKFKVVKKLRESAEKRGIQPS